MVVGGSGGDDEDEEDEDEDDNDDDDDLSQTLQSYDRGIHPTSSSNSNKRIK